MSSDYLDGYVPVTPTSFAQPVLDEDATQGLNGCETPDGHGILVWPTSTAVHFAIVDSPMDFIVDDVVPSADIGIVISGMGQVYSGSVFAAVGEIFCAVRYWVSDVFYNEIYIADDPNNPTTWTLHGTPYSAAAVTGSSFGNGGGGDMPLILDSGRWVYGRRTKRGTPFAIWEGRIDTSDDDGVTWTSQLVFEHFVFPAGRIERTASQMAHDPISGDLWWRSGTSISSADMNIPWVSTDDGDSWSHGTSDTGSPALTASLQNGTNLYAMASDGGIHVYDGSGVQWSDWSDTGENWLAPGASLTSPLGDTRHMVITSQGVFWFIADQVMFTPVSGGAWHFNVRWTT